jgi:hypothetical protein
MNSKSFSPYIYFSILHDEIPAQDILNYKDEDMVPSIWQHVKEKH